MWKKNWKKYGKIVAAAVFLTAAGLYYGFVGKKADAVRLDENGQVVAAESESIAGLGSDVMTGIGESAEYVTGNAADRSLSNSFDGANSETTDSEGVYVHICGEVMEPGVYELPEGSRIFEAVKAAGGLTDEADEASLNMAEKVSDGMQIVILSYDEIVERSAAEQEAKSGLVNINTASREQLMTLSGIGEARAEDIIRYREESGGFNVIEDIKKVPGIKDAAYLKIKDNITV